jgi:hypothetical protein
MPHLFAFSNIASGLTRGDSTRISLFRVSDSCFLAVDGFEFNLAVLHKLGQPLDTKLDDDG